jgi:type I restriction enzyme R subunit
VARLRPALRRLNPALPEAAIEAAIAEITRDRSAQSLAAANREVYRLLKDGVPVKARDAAGREEDVRVRVVDWNAPEHNDFLLVSQLTVTGEMYTRRADLVGFVNGLPLVLVELKAAHKRLENAYNDNLRDYKETIPQLFWYNALILLSNGSQSRLGTITAGWEHFAEWKKINDEGERGVVSLATMIRGVCERARLLVFVENFTLFREVAGGPIKIVARNHQYLGVNNAIAAVRSMRENQGRLGVFWHTQGSGKSYSMVFFAQKVLRKAPGNWTFLVVTDRLELDEQIYQTFAATGAVTEPEEEVHAESGAHLQRMLREDHRYLFTLIQKFQTEKGATYPALSERTDIIVMTDEAHRSQYDTLAFNMRGALPKAAFIAFTGTPLIVGEEKTRQVFGEYVSVYNFWQAIEDGATVPLYYENRIPELQLTNPGLNADMERLIAAAELDEDQEKKLDRELGREYHLITRGDRLDAIAGDIVAHFMERGEPGKAMVVAIDKATAVRMYDRVHVHWQRYLDGLRGKLRAATEREREALERKIRFMEETDMAVVVSQSQNEVADFRALGLEIAPHRKRMVTEDLETKFKDADDPLRIVFVCAMWMTGFDVPSLTTIYLDKPMRNHTLMQTIARANRVFGEKNNGLIVDYVGVFRDLEKALAIYGSDRSGGSGDGGGLGDGELPVKDKRELVEALGRALAEVEAFCRERGIDPDAILAARGFDRVALLDAADALLANDETKKRYLGLAGNVAKLYRAILPDAAAGAFTPRTALYAVVAQKMLSYLPKTDIGDVMERIARLLDTSIAPVGYVIQEEPGEYAVDRRIDLSLIDFEALRQRFEKGRKHIEAERLRTALAGKLERMVRANRARLDYLAKFQRLIDEYNAGSMNVELFFDKLLALAQELNAEEQRAIAENLSEE